MSFYRYGNQFRWTQGIPARLRGRFNCGSVLKVLSTRDADLARSYAAYLSVAAQHLFQIVETHRQLTPIEISLLLRNLTRLTETVETRDGTRSLGDTLERDLSTQVAARPLPDLKLGALVSLQKQLRSALRELNHVIGDSDEIVSRKSPEGPRLSEVMLAFLKERSLSTVRGTTELRRSFLRTFMTIVGDRPIREIGRPDLGYFKATVQKLPVKWERIYPGVPIAEILARRIEGPRLRPNTINNYVGTVHAFFEWAYVNGYVPFNPARKLKIRTILNARDERRRFSPGDLRQIFEESLYFARTSHPSSIAARKIDPQIYHYIWVPLLALFSGLRLGEIIGLERQDIKREEGVWILAVRANRFRGIKSASANRAVPIHPMLLKLGFLDAINYQGFESHDWIWPGLKRGGRHCSYSFASAWSRYKKTIGIDDPRKTFHSFRHSFIHALSQVEHRFQVIAELAGHSVYAQFYARYRKTSDLRFLLRVIRKIRFPVRLEHLVA